LYKITVAAHHMSGLWRVHISERLPQHTGHISFLTLHFTR